MAKKIVVSWTEREGYGNICRNEIKTVAYNLGRNPTGIWGPGEGDGLAYQMVLEVSDVTVEFARKHPEDFKQAALSHVLTRAFSEIRFRVHPADAERGI